MQAPDPGSSSPAAPPEALRAAFRELHGRRLHGFALLLTLGDRPRAARLAAHALSAGLTRLDDLRHPERAAAWLRARIVRTTRHLPALDLRHEARARALAGIGADGAVLTGLAALGYLDRAALVASSVERLDRRDVADIVGRDGVQLDRLLNRARRRYASAYATAIEEPASAGPLTQRLRAIADRAMG